MRILLSCLIILNGAVVMAQGPSFTNQQRTTGSIGLAAGQTAQLNVYYPTAPAPILQVTCSVTLSISDTSGKNLKYETFQQLIAGHGVSIDVNADTDLGGAARTQIVGLSISPSCQLVTNLELIDNISHKTLMQVGSEPTFPFRQSAPATTAAALLERRP